MRFNFSNGTRKVRYNGPNPSFTNYESETWGTGILARRYLPVHEKISFFGEFQSSFDWRIEENSIVILQNPQANSYSYRVFNNTLFAGLSFFPTKWVSVEASVNPIGFGLSRNTSKNIPGVVENRNSSLFNMGVNTSAIFLDINFFLNRK